MGTRQAGGGQGADRARGGDPVHSRHDHVHQDEIVAAFARRLHRRSAVGHAVDAVAFDRQHVADQLAIEVEIIGHQDVSRFGGRIVHFPSRGRREAGRRAAVLNRAVAHDRRGGRPERAVPVPDRPRRRASVRSGFRLAHAEPQPFAAAGDLDRNAARPARRQHGVQGPLRAECVEPGTGRHAIPIERVMSLPRAPAEAKQSSAKDRTVTNSAASSRSACGSGAPSRAESSDAAMLCSASARAAIASGCVSRLRNSVMPTMVCSGARSWSAAARISRAPPAAGCAARRCAVTASARAAAISSRASRSSSVQARLFSDVTTKVARGCLPSGESTGVCSTAAPSGTAAFGPTQTPSFRRMHRAGRWMRRPSAARCSASA